MDNGGVRSVVRWVGEHHNLGGGVRLARLDGCRHDHSGQLANDLHDGQTESKPRACVSRVNQENIDDKHADMNG